MTVDNFTIGTEEYAIHDFGLYSVPAFFILIISELIISKYLQKKKLWRWRESKRDRAEIRLNDVFSSLSTIVTQQIVNKVISKYLQAIPYIYCYHYLSIFKTTADGNNSILLWIFTFFAVDFFYYLFHRWSHESNVGWAAHSVHHSSEDYNFTTALRQSMIQSLLSWHWYLPLAFLGIHPTFFSIHSQINLIYQFWIHTELVPHLGPLEYFLNTPYAHRLHHARNPPYIDKNYGGTLIIYDRLLNTFADEAQEPVYGLVHPIQSFNPLHVQTENYVDIIKQFPKLPFKSFLKLVFKSPGYNVETNEVYPLPEVDPKTVKKFNPELIYPTWVRVYAFLQFNLIFIATLLYLFSPYVIEFTLNQSSNHLAIPILLTHSIVLFGSSCVIGFFFDGEKVAITAELIRLAITIAGCLFCPLWVIPYANSVVYDFGQNKLLTIAGLLNWISVISAIIIIVGSITGNTKRKSSSKKAKQQ